MGVPLAERRAAGAAAAAAADDDLVVGGAELVEDEPSALDAESRRTSPGVVAAGANALAVPTPAVVPGGAAAWQTAVDELSREAAAAKGKKSADHKAASLFEAGRILAYRMGDWGGAEARFEEALSAREDFVPALRELVRLAVSRREWERAVSLLGRQADATDDAVGKTAALLASAHIQLSELKDRQKEAAEALRAALEVHPENYTALRFLRVIHYDREEYGPLVDALEKARALAGPAEQLRIDYELGRVQDEVLQDAPAALAAFRRALDANGRLIPAFLYAEQLLQGAGDKGALTELWRSVGDAWGGADASWWRARAARLGEAAQADPDAIALDWLSAIENAEVPGFLAEEYRHWLEGRGRSGELASTLESALETAADDRERADLCATLGRLALARDGGLDDAAAWFDKALEADPLCADARDGRRQVLSRNDDWDGLLGQLAAAADAAGATRVKLALRLKQAEIALDRKDDPVGARAHLEAAVDLAPNYLPAVDSLVHVLGTLADHSARAERLEAAANLVDSAEARSTYLLRAARSWMDAGEGDKAVDALGRAGEHGPGTLLAREWLVEAHVSAGRWAEAAETLRQAAAETEDAALRVSLLYRSARVALARANDEDGAEAAYKTLLDLVPDFLPATMDLRDMFAGRGDWDSAGLVQQQEAESARTAEETAWWNLAAGRSYERAGRTQDALDRYNAAIEAVPGHPVAHASLRRVFRSSGDWKSLADDFASQLDAADDPAVRDGLRLQLIAALDQLGEAGPVAAQVAELLMSERGSQLPLAAMGILCEGMQSWDQAVAVYAAVGADEAADAAARAACTFQQGLLLEEGFEDLDGAAALYTRADELAGHHPMALENLETIYGARSDRKGLAGVYGRQAESAQSEPVRTFYALLAGDEHERLGETAQAVASYRVAFADPVGRERAYEALRRITLQARDGDTLRDVTIELAGEGTDSGSLARLMELGDGLVSIEDERAAEAFAEVTRRQPSYLGAWYQLEQLHGAQERWNDVLTALEALAEQATTKEVKAAVQARTEVLLEEKGVTSDSAWDFYTGRLKDEPENVVALRGLGGIALSRGDDKVAKGHYEKLASCAKDPAHLAEAETQLGVLARKKKSGDKDAITHFEKALEHVSSWAPAIAGLREVHEANQNWKALVGVIAREASNQPERRVELHAEIARLWQDAIDEPKIAIASWQKVLQEDPSHEEALERLAGLYEASGDWNGYLDIADRTLADLEGEALRDRAAELGVVAHERAGQTDRAITYLQTAVNADPPSPQALETLRRIHRSRGDWEKVISLSERQAALTDDQEQKVELYVEAARIRLDQLLDREAAAQLFGKALEADPACVPALQFFVAYHYDNENWNEAAQVFAGYEPTVQGGDLDDIDERMEATAFYYKYGTLLGRLGDPDGEAIGKFDKALELTPTHLPSLEAAAPRYLDASRWKEARNVCRSILQLRGGTGDSGAMTSLYLQLGRAERELGDTKSSLKRYKKVLEISPNNVEALLGIASVHQATGEWNSLLSTYNSIIKYARDPDQVIDAYLTKGDVLERKLQFTDKAVLHYEKVLMYDKNNVAAMTRLGQIALKRGEAERATELAARAIEAARDDDDKRLGVLLERLVRSGESVDVDGLVGDVVGAAGDGSVLAAFREAASGGKLSREEAAEAYAQASTSV